MIVVVRFGKQLQSLCCNYLAIFDKGHVTVLQIILHEVITSWMKLQPQQRAQGLYFQTHQSHLSNGQSKLHNGPVLAAKTGYAQALTRNETTRPITITMRNGCYPSQPKSLSQSCNI